MEHDPKLKQLADAAEARRTQQADAQAQAEKEESKRRDQQGAILETWERKWRPALDTAIIQVNKALGNHADDRLKIEEGDYSWPTMGRFANEGQTMAWMGVAYTRDEQALETVKFFLMAPVSIRAATVEVRWDANELKETFHIEDQLDVPRFFLHRLVALVQRHQ
jgi:hypothetical protein